MDKHFKFQFNKDKNEIESEEVRSKQYWRNRFYLAEIEAEAFMNRRRRQYDESFQRLSDRLDDYYFYEKLRYSCAMVNLEGIGSSKYNIGFIQEIIGYFSQLPDLDFHIEIYLKIYQSLTQPEDEEKFFELKQLIRTHQDRLSKAELREIILFTINICARKIRQGNDAYFEQALELYLLGIENKTLFAGNNLTHWTFNNVVKVALRLQRYQWLENFVNEYSQYLAPNVREESMNFTWAELAFSQQDYDAVLTYINRIKFTDPQYYLGSRVMLLKSFYELDAIDSMSSQLASFSMFLRRNKTISAQIKKSYLNFCTLLHLILRSKPGKKEKVIDKIQTTKQKIEGPWLLEIAENML